MKPKIPLEKVAAKNGHGGERPRAGRKPGVPNILNRTLREKAAVHGDDMLATLVDIAKDAGEPSSVRVQAAIALLDRGYGKPTQSMEVSAQVSDATDYKALDLIFEQAILKSEQQRLAMIERRKTLLCRPPEIQPASPRLT